MVPLKQVFFDIDVCQGFADYTIHQAFENETDHPIEVIYMIPTSDDNFSCNKIAVEFTLPDGSVEQIETRIREREQA